MFEQADGEHDGAWTAGVAITELSSPEAATDPRAAGGALRRAGALDRLVEIMFRSLSRCRTRHLLITGPAGVGKTTLVREFARRASAGEIPFLCGRQFVWIDGRDTSSEESGARFAALLGKAADHDDGRGIVLCLDGLGQLLRSSDGTTNKHILRRTLSTRMPPHPRPLSRGWRKEDKERGRQGEDTDNDARPSSPCLPATPETTLERTTKRGSAGGVQIIGIMIDREFDELLWAAWQRSQSPLGGAVVTENQKGQSTRKSLRHQHGDARFLDIVSKCISQRCVLLGLQPASPAPEGLTDDSVSLEFRRERIFEYVAALRSTGTGTAAGPGRAETGRAGAGTPGAGAGQSQPGSPGPLGGSGQVEHGPPPGLPGPAAPLGD